MINDVKSVLCTHVGEKSHITNSCQRAP